MKTTLEALIQDALTAHQIGDFARAYQLYQQIIQLDPYQTDALHMLGMLAAQQGDYQQAIEWFHQALAIKKDAVYYNNLGNAYKALQQGPQAEFNYQQALQLKPDYAEAHNNLASLLYKQGTLACAIEHLQRALILQPNYLEATVNLGLAYLKQGDWQLALVQFKTALQNNPNLIFVHLQLANIYMQQNEIDLARLHYEIVLNHYPEYAEALNNLGAIALKQQQPIQAIEYFTKVLQIEPQHTEARNNLAATLLQQDRYTEAIWHYQLYLQLNPHDFEAYYNLGVAQMGATFLPEAVQAFEKTITLKPDHIDAYCNLAALALKKMQPQQAVEYYQQALRHDPHNPAVQYMLSALTGGAPPPAAPAEYVKNLFDAYAGYFDQHLTETLHYQIPQLLRQALNKWLNKGGKKIILDLGCGSGLSGNAIRDSAAHLVGIDISPRMLAKAREKNIYDELIESDIIQYLTSNTTCFDLILAADILVYFGDLTSLFNLVYKSLPHQGLFTFTVEKGDDETYKLQPSGRYAHSTHYILTLAKQLHFKVLLNSTISGRLQQGTPVESYLFVLQKI